MRINLRPRLAAVFDMLGCRDSIADVGCDHGRLSMSLIQTGHAKRVIASDISEPSIEKARALCEKCGLAAQCSFTISDGLTHLRGGDADAIAICGMGGELIADILRDGDAAARSASIIVMQPMRGVSELRRYLYENSYRIVDERIVYDAARYYQIIAAASGAPDPLPQGFPDGVYEFGALCAMKRDPLLLPMLEMYRAGHMRRLDKARARDSTPAPLVRELRDIDALISFVKEILTDEAK